MLLSARETANADNKLLSSLQCGFETNKNSRNYVGSLKMTKIEALPSSLPKALYKKTCWRSDSLQKRNGIPVYEATSYSYCQNTFNYLSCVLALILMNSNQCGYIWKNIKLLDIIVIAHVLFSTHLALLFSFSTSQNFNWSRVQTSRHHANRWINLPNQAEASHR